MKNLIYRRMTPLLVQGAAVAGLTLWSLYPTELAHVHNVLDASQQKTQTTAQEEELKQEKQNASSTMNLDLLGKILNDKTQVLKHEGGYWECQYYKRVILVVTDESHNRMRIISPIIEQEKILNKQYLEMLEAQFDRALDVKYAISNEVLWSAFVHPLGELTEEQVIDALDQVYYAAENFGGSYVSTNLKFGGDDEDGEAVEQE